VAPGGGRGLWLRCTVKRAPGGAARGAVWAAVVDPAQADPVAVRADDLLLGTGDGAWIRCGDSTFGPAGTRGSADVDGRAISWDLTYTTAEPALLHLPRPWMYGARLPRTKLASPLPAVTVDGHVTVDGRITDLAGWRGTVGHNWGEQHAERWVWLYGIVADGPRAGSWIDLAAARIRIGPVTVPWTAFGAITLDQQRIPLGGLGRRATVSATTTDCSLTVSGRDITVTATVDARTATLVAWNYLDPAGTRHPVTNTPVADVHLLVERKGHSPLELTLDARGVYELGQTSR
jgi:hypothetical protein